MLFKYRRCPACGAPVAISTVLRPGVRVKGERNIKCEACNHTISKVYNSDKFGFAMFYLILALGSLLVKILGVESIVTILIATIITPIILAIGFYHFLPFSDHDK